MLEQNVYGLIPDIPTINLMNKNIPLHVTPEDIIERAKIQIDINTGYKFSAIEKMKRGLLLGSFRELYIVKELPDYNIFVAGKVKTFPPIYSGFPISPYFKNGKVANMQNQITEEQTEKNGLDIRLTIIVLLSCIIVFLLIKKNI
jgi:hypothetical protein